jgi:hypothetical protein
MAYRLGKDEPVAGGVRRIVAEEATAAAEGLRGGADRDKAVHEARKSVKKIRALLRLAGHSAENTRLRNLGRKLSPLRDRGAMLALVASLRNDGAAAVLDALAGRLRETLPEEGDVIPSATAAFERLARRASKLNGFKPVERGLQRAYRKGRRMLAEAGKEGTDESFHEWRKAAKDHWYHLRLLGVSPKREKSLAQLCDCLGDDHNLVVLRGYFEAEPRAYGSASEVAALLERIEKRQSELRARALKAGGRLYAAKPKSFVRRVAA